MQWLSESEFRLEVARWVGQMYCVMRDEEDRRFAYCQDRAGRQHTRLWPIVAIIIVACVLYPYSVSGLSLTGMLLLVLVGVFAALVYIAERSREWRIFPEDNKDLEARTHEAFLELPMDITPQEKEQIRQLKCLTQSSLVASEEVVKEIDRAVQYENLAGWTFLIDLYRLYTVPESLRETSL